MSAAELTTTFLIDEDALAAIDIPAERARVADCRNELASLATGALLNAIEMRRKC